MMIIETSLMVQWLRLHAADAGGVGSTPGQTTKITTCCLACPPAPPPPKKNDDDGLTKHFRI